MGRRAQRRLDLPALSRSDQRPVVSRRRPRLIGTSCTSSCTRRPHFHFSTAPRCPKRSSIARRRSDTRRSRCSIATASTARRAFISRRSAPGIKAIIGAELTMAIGTAASVFRLPVLVESREGYRNLCRLVTRMKLRSPKGEGALAHRRARRPCRRTGGARRARPRSAGRASASAGSSIASSGRSARANVCVEVQRHLLRDEEADNQALVDLASAFHVPVIATNGVRFAEPANRPLYDVLTCIRHKTTLERAGRRLTWNAERYLKSPDAMARLFSDMPAAIAGDARAGRSARLHDGGSRLPLSGLPGARRRNDGVVSQEDHAGGRARAVSAVRRSRAPPGRARARSDREARSRRLLPHRLGHRQLLPAGGHSRSGARLGRQQRRVLQPRDHGRRSGRHGSAVRAIPVGRARRMARHRSRSAERRSPRAGDPASV